jgi:hypothetical protein
MNFAQLTVQTVQVFAECPKGGDGQIAADAAAPVFKLCGINSLR